MNPKLPDAICFRVTRRCNARCGFCLAPPNGENPDHAALSRRLDWLFSRGVKAIHFCGGEPTLHPALSDLLRHAHALGLKNRITTNAIEVPGAVLSALRATGAHVKVSLHGNRAHHDRMVGCEAFDRTVLNLRRLMACGVATSVQSTMVAGGTEVLDWMVDFCRGNGIRRLSVIPFLPRGRGRGRREEFGLDLAQRSALREMVKRKRRDLGAALDLRWLDFSACGLHVVEVDGRILMEGPTEARDQLICTIP